MSHCLKHNRAQARRCRHAARRIDSRRPTASALLSQQPRCRRPSASACSLQLMRCHRSSCSLWSPARQALTGRCSFVANKSNLTSGCACTVVGSRRAGAQAQACAACSRRCSTRPAGRRGVWDIRPNGRCSLRRAGAQEDWHSSAGDLAQQCRCVCRQSAAGGVVKMRFMATGRSSRRGAVPCGYEAHLHLSSSSALLHAWHTRVLRAGLQHWSTGAEELVQQQHTYQWCRLLWRSGAAGRVIILLNCTQCSNRAGAAPCALQITLPAAPL